MAKKSEKRGVRTVSESFEKMYTFCHTKENSLGANISRRVETSKHFLEQQSKLP